MGDPGELKRLYDGIERLGSKFDDFASTTSNRLTKIETMFTMFEKAQNNISNKVDEVEKVAIEAMASTKAAHKRLDSFATHTELDSVKTRVDKHDKIIFWITTLIIGSVVLAVISTVMINK